MRDKANSITASIASAAGPAYTVELAHPAYRGTMAGMYNNFWWLGNILAGWTTYGTNLHFPESSWAWRTPTIVQCGLPSIVMALILFFPETVSSICRFPNNFG
jgi:MFS family permease